MATKKTATKAPAHRSRKQVAESFADMSKEALSHAKAQLGRPSWPKQECAQQKISAGLADGFANYGQLATPRSEIDAVLGDICHSLDDLEDAQGQCINAIADILRQENPPAQTPQETAAMPSAPLVNRLRSILRNLDSIIERQVAINARIVL